MREEEVYFKRIIIHGHVERIAILYWLQKMLQGILWSLQTQFRVGTGTSLSTWTSNFPKNFHKKSKAWKSSSADTDLQLDFHPDMHWYAAWDHFQSSVQFYIRVSLIWNWTDDWKWPSAQLYLTIGMKSNVRSPLWYGTDDWKWPSAQPYLITGMKSNDATVAPLNSQGRLGHHRCFRKASNVHYAVVCRDDEDCA